MLVKELIKKLQCMDGNHEIEIQAEYDCSHDLSGGSIDNVEFKNGKCIITSLKY